jgi:hypothetical protein
MKQLTHHLPTTKYSALGLAILLTCLSANYAFGFPPSPASQKQRPQPQDSQLVEQFSFFINDFTMEHQSQTNTLNTSVRYRYAANISNAEYPDFRGIAKDIETSLNNYPNETDYWEILNKQLTSMVMKKYPVMTQLTIEIAVSPSSVVPFLRSSTVTRNRSSNPTQRRKVAAHAVQRS